MLLGIADEGSEEKGKQDEPVDLPDSPWTIETIDGEGEETDEVRPVPTAHRADRTLTLISVVQTWNPHRGRSARNVRWQTRAAARRFCSHDTHSTNRRTSLRCLRARCPPARHTTIWSLRTCRLRWARLPSNNS